MRWALFLPFSVFLFAVIRFANDAIFEWAVPFAPNPFPFHLTHLFIEGVLAVFIFLWTAYHVAPRSKTKVIVVLSAVLSAIYIGVTAIGLLQSAFHSPLWEVLLLPALVIFTCICTCLMIPGNAENSQEADL